MDEYLRLYKSADEDDKLFVLTLSLEGSVLNWWYKRRVHITTWEGAKKALLSQYGDNFIKDNSRSELEELHQTSRIQDYLAEVERLNGHANLSEEVIIALIYRKIKPKLREMMAPFHAIRKTELKAWINMLISCGESMEHNDRLCRSSTNYSNSNSNSSNSFKKRSADQISTPQTSAN